MAFGQRGWKWQPLGGLAGQFFAPAAKLLSMMPPVPRLLSWRAADRRMVARLVKETGSTPPPAMVDIYHQLDQTNLTVLGIALVTLLTAVVVKRVFPRLPNLLLGLIAGSLTAAVASGSDQGVTFVGQIPAQLPPLSMPDFSVGAIRQLAPEAFAVAAELGIGRVRSGTYFGGLGPSYETRAEVTYVSTSEGPGQDGTPRLGLKFLDAPLPESLIPEDAKPLP